MDTQLTIWPSPAKLNLFLHINQRLANGYHHLQSVFQILDYGDSLQFSINNSGEISLTQSIAGVADEQNLIIRAAKLLQQHRSCQMGAQISLNKVLPMGGGLGGGSSNAATTLLALNYYWQTNLSQSELAELGLQLGADVPIFIHGQSAFAEGVGEIITPLALPQSFYVVIQPDAHISTGEIFNHVHLPRNTARIKPQQYEFQTTVNDCQDLVFSRHPKVAKALQWLIEYAPSRMTGTGACVFAKFDQKEAAEHCFKQMPKHFSGFIADGVNTSPVHKLLAKLQHHSK